MGLSLWKFIRFVISFLFLKLLQNRNSNWIFDNIYRFFEPLINFFTFMTKFTDINMLLLSSIMGWSEGLTLIDSILYEDRNMLSLRVLICNSCNTLFHIYSHTLVREPYRSLHKLNYNRVCSFYLQLCPKS